MRTLTLLFDPISKQLESTMKAKIMHNQKKQQKINLAVFLLFNELFRKDLDLDKDKRNAKGREKARRIAERAVGHELPPGAEVHHWDGDPTNNKNNNLLICPDRQYHIYIHQMMKKKGLWKTNLSYLEIQVKIKKQQTIDEQKKQNVAQAKKVLKELKETRKEQRVISARGDIRE